MRSVTFRNDNLRQVNPRRSRMQYAGSHVKRVVARREGVLQMRERLR